MYGTTALCILHKLEGAVAARIEIYEPTAPLTLKPHATHRLHTHTIEGVLMSVSFSNFPSSSSYFPLWYSPSLYSLSFSFSLSPSRVSEALQQIFSGRAQIRGEQLDLERQLKENELRQRYCEEDNLQVQYFCAKEKTEKVVMLTLLSTDSNIPAENQQLSHHFTSLFSEVVLASHLRHCRKGSLLPNSWRVSVNVI